MRRILQRDLGNAALAWSSLGIVLGITGWSVRRGAIDWVLFGSGLAVILALPAVAYRSPSVAPPWPVTLLAAVPFAIGGLAPDGPVARFATQAALGMTALVVVAQIVSFTRVKMNRGFAVVLVVMTTVTAAGTWELGKWLADLVAGTALVESNEAVMWRLLSATVAGIAAGIVFDLYLRRQPDDELVPDGFDPEDADDQVEAIDDAVSDALEAVGLTAAAQRYITRGLQGLLAVLVVVGVVTLHINLVVNATIGLAATFLPAVLKRDYGLSMDIGLTLWIAVAVAIHSMGTLWFYQTVWGYHNLAHAVTGTVVAAVGYTMVRALETHTTAVTFPPKFTFIFVVLFVFSVGVFWEFLEFTLDHLAALIGRDDVVLAQHGLLDTMSDLLANTVGALVVAGMATLYRLR